MNSLEDAFGCLITKIYFSHKTVYIDIYTEEHVFKNYRSRQIKCDLFKKHDKGKIVIDV